MMLFIQIAIVVTIAYLTVASLFWVINSLQSSDYRLKYRLKKAYNLPYEHELWGYQQYKIYAQNSLIWPAIVVDYFQSKARARRRLAN